MWFLRALTLSLLSFNAFAAKKPTGGKYELYHSKSPSATALQIDDKVYDDLTAAPRDYTAVVLLTALEARFGCQLCREFQPEWDVIAKSWNKGDRDALPRVLYSTLDFAEGKGTFQKVSAVKIDADRRHH